MPVRFFDAGKLITCAAASNFYLPFVFWLSLVVAYTGLTDCVHGGVIAFAVYVLRWTAKQKQHCEAGLFRIFSMRVFFTVFFTGKLPVLPRSNN